MKIIIIAILSISLCAMGAGPAYAGQDVIVSVELTQTDPLAICELPPEVLIDPVVTGTLEFRLAVSEAVGIANTLKSIAPKGCHYRISIETLGE